MTISAEARAFQQKFEKNPSAMTFFLWLKLPSAFWSGVRLKSLSAEKAVATVPFKRFSQNPFQSIYFACLAMAAELSTGALSLMAIQGKKCSMLVSHLEADFVKKATSRIYFTCEDGPAIFAAVEKSAQTGEGETVVATSIGRTEDGTEVARFRITWSFKVKTK